MMKLTPNTLYGNENDDLFSSCRSPIAHSNTPNARNRPTVSGQISNMPSSACEVQVCGANWANHVANHTENTTALSERTGTDPSAYATGIVPMNHSSSQLPELDSIL